jgi:hypothetical protein
VLTSSTRAQDSFYNILQDSLAEEQKKKLSPRR